MQIPPTSGPNFQSPGRTPDPIIEKFNDLWEAWWNSQQKEGWNSNTQKAAEKLIAFMDANHDHLSEVAEKLEKIRAPKPKIPFEQSFASAIKTLQAWIDRGGVAEAPSEYITHMAEWFNWFNE